MEERLDLVMAVMETAFDPQWGEAWNRRQVRDALTTPNTHCQLAYATSEVEQNVPPAAGFLLSRAAPGDEEILLLAVRPEYRRQGIAGRLVADFKHQARLRGAERLFLEMRVNNPAIAFYEAHCFVSVGRRRDYYRQADGSYLDAITFAYNIVDIEKAFA